jgi:hypothetical protein
MRVKKRSVLFFAIAGACVWPFLTGCSAIAKKPAEGKGKEAGKAGKEAAEKPLPEPEWNDSILAAIESMPIGGGYSTSVDARDALMAAVLWEEGKPALRPKKALPSFCSGATYLVFTVALAQQQRAGKCTLSPETWRALVVEGQADGEGVWGRWNANGPGTGRLFEETGAGRNFTDLRDARRGDFMKIFWNDSIGAAERGHSVIFLGVETEKGEESVSFWSSNQPGGYGSKKVPRSKIKRMLFSRLEKPERLEEVLNLTPRDAFLASLEEKSVSPAEAARAVGLKRW